MARANTLQTQMTPEMILQVRARGDGDADAMRTITARYLALLAMGRTVARAALDPDEVGAIIQMLNGSILDETSAHLVWMEIADVQGELAQWGIDTQLLSEKLQRLGPLVNVAVADAAERYWRAVGHGIQADPRVALLDP